MSSILACILSKASGTSGRYAVSTSLSNPLESCSSASLLEANGNWSGWLHEQFIFVSDGSKTLQSNQGQGLEGRWLFVGGWTCTGGQELPSHPLALKRWLDVHVHSTLEDDRFDVFETLSWTLYQAQARTSSEPWRRGLDLSCRLANQTMVAWRRHCHRCRSWSLPALSWLIRGYKRLQDVKEAVDASTYWQYPFRYSKPSSVLERQIWAFIDD